MYIFLLAKSAADIPAADIPTADIPTVDIPAADIPAVDIHSRGRHTCLYYFCAPSKLLDLSGIVLDLSGIVLVEPWLSELSELSEKLSELSGTVGHCRTVGLSDLSDCRITVGQLSVWHHA